VNLFRSSPRGVAFLWLILPATNYENFITQNSRPMSPAFLPEMDLFTADESLPLWTRAQEWIAAGDIPLPFWAFPWAGGQGLARFILDHPNIVIGRCVLDFGSGSGVVAIAAKKAGARRVIACDIDPFARTAIALNAELNRVDIEVPVADVMKDFPTGVDLVTAGDVFYERAPALMFMTWFREIRRDNIEIYVGDPGRHYVPKDELEEVASYTVPTSRELEDLDSRTTTIFRVR